MCSKLLDDAADLQGSKFGIIVCTQPDVSDNSLSGSNLDLYRREAITMEDKITIHQLAGKLVAELKKCGFSECTIWQCYMPCVSSIERYYEKLGQVSYDPVVTDALDT